ncbi:hypothetical protein EVAR_44081_1 [Eumeta japonica]|uniref:Uncharacterized protein n=1 Tax=Eumeta variegata TaxID=151549 RepID=A0A4C1X4M0_EUMVA|nr:hypothetical protein EVAR_44081_1 [Eumeta japonica]
MKHRPAGGAPRRRDREYLACAARLPARGRFILQYRKSNKIALRYLGFASRREHAVSLLTMPELLHKLSFYSNLDLRHGLILNLDLDFY